MEDLIIVIINHWLDEQLVNIFGARIYLLAGGGMH